MGTVMSKRSDSKPLGICGHLGVGAGVALGGSRIQRERRVLFSRLEAAGVRLEWARTQTAGRASNALRVRVAFWADGTATVNLVEVPVGLARECVEAGLARGTRW